MHCYIEAFIPPKNFSGQSLLLARACKTQAQKSPVQAAWRIKHTACTTSKPETDKALKQQARKQYFARYIGAEIWLFKRYLILQNFTINL